MVAFKVFLLCVLALAIVNTEGRGRSKAPVKVSDFIGKHFSKPDENKISSRKGKLFPVFSIVTFPNVICNPGGGRNGTCYTSEECSSRSGSSSGTCAQGFGVCCIFSLSCGATTSENCTYLTESSISTTNPDPCVYKICKSSAEVCRIKFDFMTFNIAGPAAGTATALTTGATNSGDAIGDCVTDTFAIASPGNVGSPVICGFNTGQHMIMDASTQCVTATFNLGASSSESRSWDIKITQHTCAERDVVGPDGCLQFFTGTTGTISNFNFPTTDTAVGLGTTHLSSQCYDICIRRESGQCAICYIPAVTTTPDSFGLSVASTIATDSMQETSCSTDYLVIPNAEAIGGLVIGTIPGSTFGRLCGRFFTTINNGIASASVCSQTRPFKITVKTDATEVTTATADNDPMPNNNEQNGPPAGIIGFSLNYAQQAC